MFILSKGKPKTFNPIKDKVNKCSGKTLSGTIRVRDGSTRDKTGNGIKKIAKFGQRHNVWAIAPEMSSRNRLHPAPFPETLANDHIISWSNPGDVVLDPFCGSGTTCKMAKVNGRHYVGIDISQEYCEIARRRVAEVTPSLFAPER